MNKKMKAIGTLLELAQHIIKDECEVTNIDTISEEYDSLTGRDLRSGICRLSIHYRHPNPKTEE